jgi:hypothetical protein
MLDFGQRETIPMADETVERFLARREQELMSTASTLRSQLAPVEAELLKVQRMRAVLTEPTRPVNALASVLAQSNSNADFSPAPPNALFSAGQTSLAEIVIASYANRTIKDLIIQALIDAFPHGATISELKDFMHNGYGRTVDIGSLRTQLHRLKGAGILGQSSSDTWNFMTGQRSRYARYDHPRKNNPDLQDEPDPSAILKQLIGDKGDMS